MQYKTHHCFLRQFLSGCSYIAIDTRQFSGVFSTSIVKSMIY